MCVKAVNDRSEGRNFFVCIYKCTYVHAYMYTYVHTYIHIHTYMHTHIYTLHTYTHFTHVDNTQDALQ